MSTLLLLKLKSAGWAALASSGSSRKSRVPPEDLLDEDLHCIEISGSLACTWEAVPDQLPRAAITKRTGWLQATEIHPLSVLGARRLKSRRWEKGFLLGAEGHFVPCLCPRFWGLTAILVLTSF